MSNHKPIYFDNNATTPVDQRVRDEILYYLTEEFGNEGSRTHYFGAKAKSAVQGARERLAQLFGIEREDVVFTSGATESCNIAIQGLAKWGEKNGKQHIICSQIEHKAVIEPVQYLERHGFKVDFIPALPSGQIDLNVLTKRLRPETLIVAAMASNNETGIIQPIDKIAEHLKSHDAYLFCDASQAVGKKTDNIINSRIDLLALSGHKIFGPKGTGCLLLKKRGFKRPPIEAITFGGGQERGLRPGTLAVHGIMGLAKAVELAFKEEEERSLKCLGMKKKILSKILALNPQINGDQTLCMSHVLNVSFPGINSEAAIVALKDYVAISNGSACTSSSYSLSHVLSSMSLSKERIQEALRFSWNHHTPEPDWDGIISTLSKIKATS